MNASMSACANAAHLAEVSVDELSAVSGGLQYSTALFDQNAVTGVLFYDDGRIVAMVKGKVVGRTGPNPS